jgi:DNA-binding NarL/FixJ family response regulator
MIRERNIVAALEHLYGRPDAPLQAWSDGFLPHLRALLPQSTRVSLTSMSFRTRRSDFASIEGAGPELFARFMELGEALPDDAIAQLYRPPHPVTMFRAMPLSDGVPYTLSLIEALFGASDLLGLVSEPEPGLGVVAAAIMPDRSSLDGRTRAALARIALHLESATRLRHRPDAVVGYVTPAGRVELTAAAAQSVDARVLSASTRGMDRARTHRHRADGEGALAVWPALVSGWLSLAERVDTDGKRLYDLYENAPRHVGLRALSARESTLVHEAARGLSNKEIAYALGLSSATVSNALSGAAQKLGLTSARVLVRLASALRGAGSPVVALAELSAAERAVVELVARGWSNAQIARARGASARTVANQVAAALRKTGANSRRALAMFAP